MKEKENVKTGFFINHECIMNVSWIYHECIMNVSWMYHACTTQNWCQSCVWWVNKKIIILIRINDWISLNEKEIRSLIEYIISDFIIKWMVKQVNNVIST